jgi:hypothetical protein
MEKESLNYYLYISWTEKVDSREFLSYMKVMKNIVETDLCKDLKELGIGVFVFSSNFCFDSTKEKIKHRKYPYMLVDITINISTASISTYLKDEEIDILNKFVYKNKENKIDYLEYKLKDCVLREDYESAAFYRDLIKDTVLIEKNELLVRN